MKYLAILKDSLREAIDTKVFYVMVGLSFLVILAIASVGFEPIPADAGLRSIVEHFPGSTRPPFGNVPAPVHYDLEGFQQINEAGRPWQAEYRFHITVTDAPNAPKAFRTLVSVLEKLNADRTDREARGRSFRLSQEAQATPGSRLKDLMERLGLGGKAVTTSQMERFIKEQLAAHGTLETTRVQVESEKDDQVRFLVEVKPKEGTYLSWPHQLSFFFGALPTQFELPIGTMVYAIEASVVGEYGAGIAMLISTIITAFFIPNMLRKGTVDLLLVKPIHRTTLLIYKFIGGLSFMFLNTTVIVLGVWIVMGLRSRLWAPNFLLVIFILTFEFAIFYAVSTLFAVLTQSPIVSILMASFTWVVLFIVGVGHQSLELFRDSVPRWLTVSADTAHFVLPRYKDLDALTQHLLARDLLGPESPNRKIMDDLFASINWQQSLGFSAGFIAVLLGFACLRFAFKDY
jgi:hypothetical protein